MNKFERTKCPRDGCYCFIIRNTKGMWKGKGEGKKGRKGEREKGRKGERDKGRREI